MKNIYIVALLLMMACGYEPSAIYDTTDDTTRDVHPVADAISFPSFELIGEIDGIFQHPESIVFDSASKFLYVSNVGKTADYKKDGDGYISLLNIHGEIIHPRWVKGLSAPRGICILHDALYVADVDRVVKIDRKSGQILATISVSEKAMLTDVEAGSNGEVYITDASTNSIYVLQNDQVSRRMKSEDWNSPAGMYLTGDKLLLTSLGNNNLLQVDPMTGATQQIADSLRQARGVTSIGGSLIVGGLGGQLYGIRKGIDFRWPLIDLEMQRDDVADILYVADYNVLFIPTYRGHSVLAVSVIN